MTEEKEVKFERGQVSEYNGQSNIFCDFVTVTEGAQQKVYYILNDKKLDNGFYIASTVLKEAIDPQIIRTHLGVIDQDGNVVISFDNKGITLVGDKYLLAVRSEPQSASVLEAIASRNDPSAAANMVNANASIKDKINKKMKSQDAVEGKFILNDLLSEGTIYNLEGKNILSGEYYSFIGMTPEAFYCSTNVPNSPIVEVPRSDLFVAEDINMDIGLGNETVDKADSTEPILFGMTETPMATEENELDVAEVSVPKDTIDHALSASEDNHDGELHDKEVDTGSEINDNNFVAAEPFQVQFAEELNDSFENKREILPSVQPDHLFSDSSEQAVGEDVVYAVSAVVKQKRELESKVLELEKERSSYLAQTERVGDLESRITQLEAKNKKLAEDNRELRGVLYQIKKELNPSESLYEGEKTSEKTFRIAA